MISKTLIIDAFGGTSVANLSENSGTASQLFVSKVYIKSEIKRELIVSSIVITASKNKSLSRLVKAADSSPACFDQRERVSSTDDNSA